MLRFLLPSFQHFFVNVTNHNLGIPQWIIFFLLVTLRNFLPRQILVVLKLLLELAFSYGTNVIKESKGNVTCNGLRRRCFLECFLNLEILKLHEIGT